MITPQLRRFCLSALLFVAVASPGFAAEGTINQQIDQLLGDHTKYQAVTTKLQQAVVAHDAASVAELVAYPIRVKVNGKEIMLKSARAFVKYYDAIMTPKTTKAIVDQEYDRLFVNYQGIMFGSGQVWISGICHDNACKNFEAKITSIQDNAE